MNSMNSMDSIFPTSNILEIANDFGTPVWIYSAEKIRENISKLRAFDTIRYAQKAASNLNILKLIKDEGVLVDSVSLGELKRSLRVGFRPEEEEVVFTADLIDFPTLAMVIEKKITVNAGSLDMLRRLGEHSRGHRVWVRINPGFGHGHCNKTNTGGPQSKHGIWHSDFPKVADIVKEYDLKLVGLHMHIGSGVDYLHLAEVCEAMMTVVVEADKTLENLEAISAGGGITVPYKDGDPEVDIKRYFERWDMARKLIEERLRRKIRLEVEPGRFLMANAGVLLTQVHAIQNRPGNKDFLLVDAGFSDLMRPSLYGSYHHISVIAKDMSETGDRRLKEYGVAGPLCESGDVFTQEEGGIVTSRSLPEVQIGDYLLIHTTGAYGASMSSNYNSRPLAAEVLVESEGMKLIRKRQTIEDLMALEIFE